MMRIPTVLLEEKGLPRVIFSIQPSAPQGLKAIPSLMKKVYGMEAGYFDLPSIKHLEHFRELRRLTDDETLMGLCHLDVEEGVSFLGKPLHHFESKVVSTIKKNLLLPYSIRLSSSVSLSSDVFTQREIDRMVVDPRRFDKALSLFNPKESPFLMVGERYGDWLLALGRVDLLKEMLASVREKGFVPIYSGQWATFALPKAKILDVAAYAVPINMKKSFFDLTQACDLIKKFDKPVISLNPLADRKLLKNAKEAFSFLFNELKIYLAIAEITSEEEARTVMRATDGIPSLIPPRKT